MRAASSFCPGTRAIGLCLCSALLLLLWPSSGGAAPLFLEPVSYAVDGLPLRVVAGAFDADPSLDLMTGNQAGEGGPSLSFLSNRGDGTFLPEDRMTLDGADTILQAVTAGDFDGDGQADVAVAVDDVGALPVRASVLVYLNDGQGALEPPVEYLLTGFLPRCLEAADVNDDGVLDLLACHSTVVAGSPVGLVSVLVGEESGGAPTGRFAAARAFEVGTAPAELAVGRLDADEHSDVVAGDFDEGLLLVLYGSGAPGLLDAAVELGAVRSPSALAIGNVDATDLPDVLATSYATHRLATFSQTASRVFTPSQGVLIALRPVDMAVADLSGDGNLDLVVASTLGVELWYGNGLARFAFGERLSDDATLDALALEDLNGDGELDVAASSSEGDQVTVTLHVEPPAPGDANCDGRIDDGDVAALITRIFAPGCRGADVDDDGRVTAADLVLLLGLVGGEGF